MNQEFNLTEDEIMSALATHLFDTGKITEIIGTMYFELTEEHAKVIIIDSDNPN